jgi:hypothetical protein
MISLWLQRQMKSPAFCELPMKINMWNGQVFYEACPFLMDAVAKLYCRFGMVFFERKLLGSKLILNGDEICLNLNFSLLRLSLC